MKLRMLSIAAALVCCISCVEKNPTLGMDTIPVDQLFDIYTIEIPLEKIELKMADSLSGFSSTRATMGSVRDSEYGLSKKGCAITLVPVFDKEEGIDFGKDPVFKGFHFSIAKDTISSIDPRYDRILQTVNVYELEAPIKPSKDFDINKAVKHGTKRITKTTPVYNGGDSLSFEFSAEFGKRFLGLTKEELSDFSKYSEKFPGIYIETEDPIGEGGRFNLFKLQLDYDSEYQYINGNYADLKFNAEYDGVRKDTLIHFYYSPTDFYDLDSLLTNSSTGKFPQYCLNVASHETRPKAGVAGDIIPIEGGGGLKPVVSASYLREIVSEAILSKGGNPRSTVINKASLVFPFEFPDDYKEVDNLWPDILSPTCRVIADTTTSFMGLTDSSSSDENQGDINRSVWQYAPDITYHMQELIKIDEAKGGDKVERLKNGSYDIWLLIMANETVTSTTNSNSEMSDYYKYLAYQSYYNSMYGGGYGGYGYGGYGGYGSYYSNYYSYMMMAQYASGSSTSTSVQAMLDKDRFYKANLNGPLHSGKKPTLKLTFSVPKQAK